MKIFGKNSREDYFKLLCVGSVCILREKPLLFLPVDLFGSWVTRNVNENAKSSILSFKASLIPWFEIEY